MPAAGPSAHPRRAKREAQDGRRTAGQRQDHRAEGQAEAEGPPTRTQIRQARAQARTYKSQGVAVRKDARPRTARRRSSGVIEKIHGDHPQTAQQRAANKPSVDKAVLDSRLKYLRRTRKPVTTLKKELEGKGLLAKGLNSIANNSVYASGGSDSAGGVGWRKATSGSFRARGAAAITAPRSCRAKDTKGSRQARTALKDLVNFPAAGAPVRLRPRRWTRRGGAGSPEADQEVRERLQADRPGLQHGAALVEKAKGNDKAAASHLKKAGKTASEHPGFTALEAYGVKGTLGRAAGRAGQAGVAGRRQARGPRTEPPPSSRARTSSRGVLQPATSRRRPCRSSVTSPGPGAPSGSVRRLRPRSPMTLTRCIARRTGSTRPA
jgi:hypothetical protein